MNDRPTPETDASRGYALNSHYGRSEGSYLQIDRSGPFVHAEVARKLERERDEAREALRTLAEHGESEIQRLTKERDDLWQELEEYRSIAENIGAKKAVSEKEKAIQERDNLRELCRELADLVAYGLGQSCEPWSLDVMRKATYEIQKIKSMEGAK